jgi:hypothetical protein
MLLIDIYMFLDRNEITKCELVCKGWWLDRCREYLPLNVLDELYVSNEKGDYVEDVISGRGSYAKVNPQNYRLF